jgi:hypothetical protein
MDLNRERGRENGSSSVEENSELANVKNLVVLKTAMSEANGGVRFSPPPHHIKIPSSLLGIFI